MNLKKPKFWDSKKKSFLSYLLIPLTLPISISNFLSQFKKKNKSSKIKTICIGNIYIGGTGKTPLVIKIYDILKKIKKNNFTKSGKKEKKNFNF